MTYLNDWQNFYILISTASATLIGLMFVATSLAVGLHRQYAEMDAGISAFNTPTMFHFCAVLVISAALTAPWQQVQSVRVLLGVVSLVGFVYLTFVSKRMQNVPERPTPMHDWVWYLVLPLCAYIGLFITALALSLNPAIGLYFVGLALLLLLLISIRNAWDLVTFLVIERSNHKN